MAIPDLDLIKKSVTKGDINAYSGNGVVNVIVPLSPYSEWGIDTINLPPQPPPYWSFRRDDVLRATVYKEAMWAGAIGIAISKVASKAWEIESSVPLRARRGQELYLFADGRNVGWVGFLGKHLRDFLCSDNGAFVEIVRMSRSYGSKIIGIRHLDGRRCQRTGDPAIPVLYRDRKGAYHELKDHQVMCFADMPDPSETFFGVGLSAASRAYAAIYKLAAIEWYLREKVAGLNPLAIHIVNGVLDQQLQNAVKAAKDGVVTRGLTSYMGAVIIGIPAQEQPAVVTIPLAELPDGFDRKQEFDLSVLTYANAIGLDPQDLQPLTGQQLGAGAQSVVLQEKAKGRGLAAWAQQWMHQNNEKILPEGTVFAFTEKDLDDQKKRAEVAKGLAEVAKLRVETGVTTALEERNILVDEDQLPRELLVQDITAGDSLSDTEKPIEEETDTPPLQEEPSPEETTEKSIAAYKAEEETLAQRIATMQGYAREAIASSEVEISALTSGLRTQIEEALEAIPDETWEAAQAQDDTILDETI